MSREVELALRKQRLQFKSAALRRDLAQDFVGIAPAFKAVEQVRRGVTWLRANPELVAGVAVALLVIRPKASWRWARRGFIAWQAWRRLRHYDKTERHV